MKRKSDSFCQNKVLADNSKTYLFLNGVLLRGNTCEQKVEITDLGIRYHRLRTRIVSRIYGQSLRAWMTAQRQDGISPTFKTRLWCFPLKRRLLFFTSGDCDSQCSSIYMSFHLLKGGRGICISSDFIQQLDPFKRFVFSSVPNRLVLYMYML